MNVNSVRLDSRDISERLPRDLSGRRFGRWMVLNDYVSTNKERKWLCRCDCGTERYVLERSLLYGGSQSCGCLRKEKAKEAIAQDLTGKTFGELTVLHVAEKQQKNGGVWWTCQCSCGEKYDVPGTLLVTGRRTHCGSKKHEKKYAYVDLTGKRFQNLTVLYRVSGKTNKKGNIVWHCRCDCGNEVEYSSNDLMYTSIRSCGCEKKKHDAKLKTFLNHVAGTSIEAIQSKKRPANNTTGYRGVYNIHGKYLAKIVFQKKQYYLGKFENIEDAVKARQEAESVLFDGFADYFKNWKKYADMFPDWAASNPIKLVVSKDNNNLSVSIMPEVPDFCESVPSGLEAIIVETGGN